mmetsp:Transcript_17683/g.42639  ORF Transcript_17683/g.42639 Transcript_17683/m.42639 type:complete len:228 (+) Transcript_17683:1637-2320(+)
MTGRGAALSFPRHPRHAREAPRRARTAPTRDPSRRPRGGAASRPRPAFPGGRCHRCRTRARCNTPTRTSQHRWRASGSGCTPWTPRPSPWPRPPPAPPGPPSPTARPPPGRPSPHMARAPRHRRRARRSRRRPPSSCSRSMPHSTPRRRPASRAPSPNRARALGAPGSRCQGGGMGSTTAVGMGAGRRVRPTSRSRSSRCAGRTSLGRRSTSRASATGSSDVSVRLV